MLVGSEETKSAVYDLNSNSWFLVSSEIEKHDIGGSLHYHCGVNSRVIKKLSLDEVNNYSVIK